MGNLLSEAKLRGVNISFRAKVCTKRAGWLLFLRCSGILDTFSHFDPRAGFHTGVRYFFDKEEPSAAAFGCAPNTNHIMEQMLICLSLALIAGLLMSRAAKAVRLPAVTAYLLTGLLLGPFFLGRLGLSRFGFGFGSLVAVEGYGILTQVALGFIAFVIGNEFRLSALKHMGRRAVTVGVAQAVITTALVDIALVALHFARPDVISLASAITLGSIAAATAPAATLMVVKQYKADGPLTKLLLMVVAIDDAVGLVLFSASFGIANALEQGRIDAISVLVEPVVEIVFSLGLGAAAAPAGIQAVQEMQALCPDPAVASPSSILLILLNTASLQLIPTTAAVLRLQAGSAAPMEILPAVWVTSLLSVMVGILAAKLMERLTCSVSCPKTKEEAL